MAGSIACRLIVVAVSLSCVAGTLGALTSAQPPVQAPATEPLPKAEELFEKHIKACGGLEAIKKVTSRLTKGTLKRGTNSAVLTIAAAAPDKLRVTQTFPGRGDIEQGFNGAVGWQNMFGQQKLLSTPEEISQMKDRAAFYGEVDYKSHFKEFETTEKLDWAGKPAYKVRYVTQGGLEGQMVFDAESGFAVGNITQRMESAGGGEVVVILSEYKDFEGVQYATRHVQRIGEDEILITINSVDANPATLPSFDPPPVKEPAGPPK